MRCIILNWKTAHQFGPAWYEHHMLRKSVFVDKSQWDIPHTSEVEWDQYDTPETMYSIVMNDDDTCLACARMNPTTLQNGRFSYMIRDAQRGMLENIPDNLLETLAPVDATIWEGTRYAIAPGLSREMAGRAQAMVIQGMLDYAQEQDISGFLGLMPLAAYSIIRRLRFEINVIGTELRVDGRKTAVAIMPTAQSLMKAA